MNENLTLDYINRLSLEIQQLDILDTFHEMVWSQLCFTLRAQIVPSFWQHFEDDNNESVFASQHERQFEHFQKFIQAVEMLKYFFDVSIIFIKRLHQMQNCCIFLDNNDCIQKDIHKFHATLREALLGQLPSDFMQTVYSFYEVFYRLYSSIHQNADVSMGK